MPPDLRKHHRVRSAATTLSAICPCPRAPAAGSHGQPRTPSAQRADQHKPEGKPVCRPPLNEHGHGGAVPSASDRNVGINLVRTAAITLRRGGQLSPRRVTAGCFHRYAERSERLLRLVRNGVPLEY